MQSQMDREQDTVRTETELTGGKVLQPPTPIPPSTPSSPVMQRMPEENEEDPEEEPLQRKEARESNTNVENESPNSGRPVLQGRLEHAETSGRSPNTNNTATQNRTGMPGPLKTGLESLSGLDLSSVRVHYNSPKPAKVNALAYTQGLDIHLGPGQEKHLPHEGWHVVQQMQGRVSPTIQGKDVSINNDSALEREADAMGTKALQPISKRETPQSLNLAKIRGSNIIQGRWTRLGEETWTIRGLGTRVMRLETGNKEDWKGELDDLDSEDEYRRRLWGFLNVSNDPSIVRRTRAPRIIGNVPYTNTITRAPTTAEKMEFLRALYEMGGSLDLWRGGFFEGGPWTHYAERDLATFIENYQNLIIQEISSRGEVIGATGIKAIAEQGGRRPTMAMIINAGATAHKGVDLIMTANRQSGRDRETAHAIAMETIRNSGRVIRSTLEAHDSRVAFEQKIVGIIFDTVWGTIPGGGTLTNMAKGLLKVGLKEALKKAQAESGPRAQAEKINDEFVATCNKLVREGHINSADAQDAINGFEAVRR